MTLVKRHGRTRARYTNTTLFGTALLERHGSIICLCCSGASDMLCTSMHGKRRASSIYSIYCHYGECELFGNRQAMLVPFMFRQHFTSQSPCLKQQNDGAHPGSDRASERTPGHTPLTPSSSSSFGWLASFMPPRRCSSLNRNETSSIQLIDSVIAFSLAGTRASALPSTLCCHCVTKYISQTKSMRVCLVGR